MTVPKPDRRPRGEGVRALERGLDILRAVNASGGIRAGALAAQIGIPRPTVYRLLETLEELGYVERGASNDLFRVTRRALSLGDGYDASILVAQGAGPILLELGKRFVWPFDLSVYEGAAM
ncbi:MAG: helix-turn-helix domain-containing protein, partial [Hyphomicrobiales bacterium]|nr:helix-turn-helix domain-containing protein [Hyphomicrobiales bacterium]MCC2104763.1 helix-turn-helix domain-containing protein [Hyphomicrobiales bacterium]